MKAVLMLCAILICTAAQAQNRTIDSLRAVLETPLADTSRIYTLRDLGREFDRDGKQDSALSRHEEMKSLAEKINNRKQVGLAQLGIGQVYRTQGRLGKALEALYAGKKEFERLGDQLLVAACMNQIAATYEIGGNHRNAIALHLEAKRIAESVSDDIEEQRLREPDRLKIGMLMLKSNIKSSGKEFRVYRAVREDS